MAIGINKLSEKPEQEYAKMAKKMLLGNSRPPVFTRVILLVAVVCFAYYFVWNGLRAAVFLNIDTIDNPEVFKLKAQELADQYNIADGIKAFKMYGLAMMFSWLLAGAGMAVIYRRKLWGYIVFFAAMLAALICPIFVTSWSYFMSELSWLDYIVPPALIAIFFVSFKRLKKLKDEARLEGLR